MKNDRSNNQTMYLYDQSRMIDGWMGKKGEKLGTEFMTEYGTGFDSPLHHQY